MSQNDIYLILKKNPGMFLSAKELSQLTDISLSTVLSNMKALEKDLDFKFKSVFGKTQHPTKMVAFLPADETFEVICKEFNKLKEDKRFVFAKSEYLQNFMIITELRKLREELNNGTN